MTVQGKSIAPGHNLALFLNGELEKVKGVYKGSAVNAIIENLAAYEDNILDMRNALERMSAAVFRAVERGEFDEWLNSIDLSIRDFRLATRPYDKKGGKYWRFQIFPMSGTDTHAPHGHHNLASFLCVVEGKVLVREYDRIEMLDEKRVKLRFRGERIVGPGDAMITPSETESNIHWFGALTPSVKCLNFNARGYFTDTFTSGKNGRRYYDPLGVIGADGIVTGKRISKRKAIRKFENAPIESHKLKFADM